MITLERTGRYRTRELFTRGSLKLLGSESDENWKVQGTRMKDGETGKETNYSNGKTLNSYNIERLIPVLRLQDRTRRTKDVPKGSVLSQLFRADRPKGRQNQASARQVAITHELDQSAR